MDGTPSAAALTELRLAIERERDTLGELARVLSTTPDPDVARISALRRIRAEHPDARVIAFSEFASTITSLYSAMRADAGVGMLTAREARIASGRIARDELLARFAPVAQHAPPVAAHESVTLLLATDLLSEGENLQDARVVVHLDLPWNPARLAQRVGRLRRPGGAREVQSYLFEPPASSQLLLDTDTRLRRKLAAAERVIGHGIDVLPVLARESAATLTDRAARLDDASATDEGALTALFERWRSGTSPASTKSECMVAGVASHTNAWLAALDDGRIISSIDGRISDSPSSGLRAGNLFDGRACSPSDADVRSTLDSLRCWLEADRLAMTCGLDAPIGPLRRTVLLWLETLPRVLPRHERASALSLVGRLRGALQGPLPIGAERLLASIAKARTALAEDQLRSAVAITDRQFCGDGERSPLVARIVALVVASEE
jgi:hypothetical protein